MLKNLAIILALALLSVACEKVHIDPDYPTSIHRLPSSTLEKLRTEFAQNNVYLKSSLDEFGFCERHTDFEPNAQVPPVLDSLTEAEALDLIRTFVTSHPSASGVKHPGDFQIEKIRSTPAYPDGTIQWIANSSNQRVDTLEVLDSKIYFSIKNRELVSVGKALVPGNIYSLSIPGGSGKSQVFAGGKGGIALYHCRGRVEGDHYTRGRKCSCHGFEGASHPD